MWIKTEQINEEKTDWGLENSAWSLCHWRTKVAIFAADEVPRFRTKKTFIHQKKKRVKKGKNFSPTHTTYSSSYPSSSGSPVLGSQSLTTNFSVFVKVHVTKKQGVRKWVHTHIEALYVGRIQKAKTLKRPQRRWQRRGQKNKKDLLSRWIALHVRFKILFIS